MNICLNLCGETPKAHIVPLVLQNYAAALQESRTSIEITENVLSVGMHDLASIHAILHNQTTYQNDPNCWDCAQSLSTSLERQRTTGIFGDCGAYAVAVSALADRLGFGVGEWILLGDHRDPAQHIINRFGVIAVDATMPNGYMWPIPPRFRVRQVIDPGSGQITGVAL